MMLRMAIVRWCGLAVMVVAGMTLVGGAASQELNSRGQVRVSPRATATGTVGGVRIAVEYGSPFKRGRVIWGGLRPWDEWWMPGADEATTISTTAALLVGRVAVPAGVHSIYIVPGRDVCLLTVNTRTGQFHTQYSPDRDLGRTEMALRMLPEPVEQLTFTVESAANGAGLLRLSWDDREYSVRLAPPA